MGIDSTTCPLCGVGAAETFFSVSGVPLQDGVLWNSWSAAVRAPVGDIALNYCSSCGLIWNSRYSSDNITFSQYDFSLDHSPIYREFTSHVARRLARDYELRGKTIIDVGCGRGHFLTELCRRASATGIGIDPSAKAEASTSGETGEIRIIADYFSEKYADLAPDFVACRHVLDELNDQLAFVRSIRGALGKRQDAVVYFEVPDARRTFEGQLVWNIGYAKRAWYTPESLSKLFGSCGFDVLNVEPCFGDEYLGIEATPKENETATTGGAELAGISIERLHEFSLRFSDERQKWGARFDAMRANGQQMVVWGAGARTLNFLALNDCLGVVPFIVDIDPGRVGTYISGSGLQIRHPEDLKACQPDVILISNPLYVREIEQQAAEMGVRSSIEVL